MDDLHNQYPHRWLCQQAEVFNSPIQGLGVIAAKPIAAGETVGVLGGSIVHRNDFAQYRAKMTQVGIQIDDNFLIVPTSRTELEQHGVFNHSCAPNIGFSNSITFVAIRDIKPGEELVFDYAFCETYFDGFACKCNSPGCRKIITQDDWQKPEIQERYGDYFSPYLKAKIDRAPKPELRSDHL